MMYEIKLKGKKKVAEGVSRTIGLTRKRWYHPDYGKVIFGDLYIDTRYYWNETVSRFFVKPRDEEKWYRVFPTDEDWKYHKEVEED